MTHPNLRSNSAHPSRGTLQTSMQGHGVGHCSRVHPSTLARLFIIARFSAQGKSLFANSHCVLQIEGRWDRREKGYSAPASLPQTWPWSWGAQDCSLQPRIDSALSGCQSAQLSVAQLFCVGTIPLSNIHKAQKFGALGKRVAVICEALAKG